MPPLLRQLRALFAEAEFPWALCGGYALEVFVGREIRPHGDIDLCLPETARADVIAYLLDRGWRIHEYRGMGKVRPIRSAADSEPGRNLMASFGDVPPVRFFSSDEEGLLYHQFIPGMTELNFIDLLFSPADEDGMTVCGVSCPLDRAILLRAGLPVLAPEAALLYKAARADEETARLDHAAVYPLMNAEQKRWLQAGLARLYPGGHAWRGPIAQEE